MDEQKSPRQRASAALPTSPSGWGWGIVALLAFAATAASQSPSARRPNLLVLVTDDQRFDELGAAGNAAIHTPNLDALATAGVLFENAFATTAVCSSSRASILTGQYAERHGVWDFHQALSDEGLAQSYPALLGAAGYRTGYLGKYAVGDPRSAGARALPAELFDVWYGFPQRITFLQTVDGEERHLTGLLAERALEFFASGDEDQPFCLTIGFKAPHGLEVDAQQEDRYGDTPLPLSADLSDEAFAREPALLRESLAAGRDFHHAARRDPAAFDELVRARYRLLTGVDDALGRIRRALEEHGLAQDTVIVFTSDHGRLLGDHGLFGKWIMYESSIRVPLVVFDPRLSAQRRGVRRGEMVLNVDLAPTLLELAGVPVPASVQGSSLAPLLRGEHTGWRDEWYYAHRFSPRPPRLPIPRIEGVRTARWKYVRYPDVEPRFEQLFDLDSDPGELSNLASSHEHAERLADMRARLVRLRSAAR